MLYSSFLSPDLRIGILTIKQVDLDTLAVPDTLHQTYCLVNVVHKEKVRLPFPPVPLPTSR